MLRPYSRAAVTEAKEENGADAAECEHAVQNSEHPEPHLALFVGRGAKHRVLTGAQALKKFQARQAAYAKDTAHQNAQQAQQVAHGKHHKMLALAHDVVRRLKYILEEVAHSCQGVAAALRLRVDLFRSVHAADYLLAVHFAHIGMAGNDCIAFKLAGVLPESEQGLCTFRAKPLLRGKFCPVRPTPLKYTWSYRV